MDRFSLTQLGTFGGKLVTSRAQMGRMVSGKFKEILQSPTPESRMIDEATLETMEEPNWGLNLKICAMINSEEFSGSEVVKVVKRKISKDSAVTQRLSLELLEVIAMNCEKVFSEIASEKVLDEMVKMIENPQTDGENRRRAMQLIRAWGESKDLAYLPVFFQTYMIMRERGAHPVAQDGTSPSLQSTLESYIDQPLPPPESYPVPDTGILDASDREFRYNYLSVEEKKEHLVVTRNSLELLSSIMNSETDPKPLKEELTLNILDKCKESQPVIQRIIETTTDDEGMLFEALFLHEGLQQVISKYQELKASQNSGGEQLANTDATRPEGSEKVQNPEELSVSSNPHECEDLDNTQKLGDKLLAYTNVSEVRPSPPVGIYSETKIADSVLEGTPSSSEKGGH